MRLGYADEITVISGVTPVVTITGIIQLKKIYSLLYS